MIADSGRIKGTDPRVRAVTDRIGRGTRNVQAEQGARGGLTDMQEQMAQEDFARRLMEKERPLQPVRPGNVRAWHETDTANVPSIQEKGILGSERTSFGERPGQPQVYGSFDEGVAPPGRTRIPFQAPEKNITGRGTSGSRSVSFSGNVPPEDLYSGPPAGGALNAFSNILMLASAPTPSGHGSLGSSVQDWMTRQGILPADFRLGQGEDLMQRIQSGGPPVPRPYGADVGWGTGSIPAGSLMEYALAQAAQR